MGRGHNLQRADRVIFGEFSWTDELNKQAEKRASRRGNERAFVRCEYVVAPGSIDEKVVQALFTKEKRVREIIG
jgi:SNF2 family DNA or RNA helicase